MCVRICVYVCAYQLKLEEWLHWCVKHTRKDDTTLSLKFIPNLWGFLSIFRIQKIIASAFLTFPKHVVTIMSHFTEALCSAQLSNSTFLSQVQAESYLTIHKATYAQIERSCNSKRWLIERYSALTHMIVSCQDRLWTSRWEANDFWWPLGLFLLLWKARIKQAHSCQGLKRESFPH